MSFQKLEIWENGNIYLCFVQFLMNPAQFQTGIISWSVVIIFSEKFPPVRLDVPRNIQPDAHIHKTRAYALLRLLSHPRFAHLGVGC